MKALVFERTKVPALRNIEPVGALAPSEVRPLIADRHGFTDSTAAFDYASNPKPRSVKVQIERESAFFPNTL